MQLLRWLWRRRSIERDLDAELKAHLDMAIADRVAAGEDPGSARLSAMNEFGNVLQANAVTNIRLGSGAGVTLTALGDELEAIIGCGPFSFPFFSNPETFDRAELTITRGAF